MTNLIGAIIKCIPLMIGAALTPLCLMIVFLLLRSDGGLIKAMAFVAGQILVRLAQGLAFGYEFGHSVMAKANAHVIVDTLVMLAGILLWITAARKLRKEVDPDEPPPKWMATIHAMHFGRIFMISTIWMAISPKQWIFTLGAMGIIAEANLNGAAYAVAYLIFIFGAQSLMLGPIVITVLNPNQSSRFIDASSAWVERNNKRIVIAMSVVFGGYLFYKGFTGLFVNS